MSKSLTTAAALGLIFLSWLIVSRSMLDELAFVPSSVGKAVHIQGATPIWVTLDVAVAARTAHYRVELEPRGMEVQIPAITLEATAVEGNGASHGLCPLRQREWTSTFETPNRLNSQCVGET